MAHKQFESCITTCNECADACDHCAVACLDEKNVADMAGCIKLDMDCAAICRLAVSYMARGSDFAQEICELCAQVCDDCAEECGRHQMDHCQQCAEACRRCAEACRKMAGAGRTRDARPDVHAGAH